MIVAISFQYKTQFEKKIFTIASLSKKFKSFIRKQMQRSHGVIASQNTAWKNMLVPSNNKTKQSTLKVKEIQDVYVRCAHGTSCVSNIIVTTIVLFISTVYIVTAAMPPRLLVTRPFPAALSGHFTCWLGPATSLLTTFTRQRENRN